MHKLSAARSVRLFRWNEDMCDISSKVLHVYFFGSITLTCMALIEDLFSCVFPRKLCEGSYRNYVIKCFTLHSNP